MRKSGNILLYRFWFGACGPFLSKKQKTPMFLKTNFKLIWVGAGAGAALDLGLGLELPSCPQ